MKYQNPIIPGFYPDPSICRVGNDYYLVTSTFQYFPGVPVFHSTDLVNWEQIGHCLSRASQLQLGLVYASGGIFAPTIRYHKGLFYMVTTNVSSKGNFYVYTEDPAGEWSEPIWVDQGGIDPSLLFDEDGSVYLTSTTHENNTAGICLSQIDIKTGVRLTESKMIWTGSGGRHPEAPHLYKINDYYYLMLAEGGTEYGHMVTIGRSKSPWGAFEAYDKNPILTNRNCDGSTPIQGTGHGDLFEDQNGDWWMVFLAFRPAGGDYHHLGRETCLAPVEWNEAGWPIVNGNGTANVIMESDKITAKQLIKDSYEDNFEDSTFDLQWNFIANPYEEMYSLTERKGYLRLRGSGKNLKDGGSPTFIGKRQQHFDCTVTTELHFNSNKENEEAGLTVYMNEKHHYDIAVVGGKGKRNIIVRRTIGKLSAIVAKEEIGEGEVILQINANKLEYNFEYAVGEEGLKDIATGETKYLSSEVAGGFTGVYIGLYATGNGEKSVEPADFDYFKYKYTETK